jgi:hypothetical protein
MKIPLGGGAYLEPGEGPRDSQFHKRIQRVAPIPNTRVGNYLVLECGHVAMAFGNLAHAGGVALCTDCRDQAKAQEN